MLRLSAVPKARLKKKQQQIYSFAYKTGLPREKSATKFSPIKTLSGKIVRKNYLQNSAQIVGGGRPLKPSIMAHHVSRSLR